MIVAITCEAFMCYNIQTKDKKVFHSSKVNIQSFFATLMFGAIQKVRTLSRGVPKKRTKAYRGRGEVMQECMYAHNLASTRSFYFVLLCLFP